MNEQSPSSRNQADQRSAPELVTDSLLSEDMRAARWQRIDQFQQHGAENPQPFEATMASMQAQLFRDAFALRDAVQTALAGSEVAVETMLAVESELRTHLRTSRRIERNAALDLTAWRKDSRPTQH